METIVFNDLAILQAGTWLVDAALRYKASSNHWNVYWNDEHILEGWTTFSVVVVPCSASYQKKKKRFDGLLQSQQSI
jgi:hypothetical protein